MQHNGSDTTLGNNTIKYITEIAVHKTVNIKKHMKDVVGWVA